MHFKQVLAGDVPPDRGQEVEGFGKGIAGKLRWLGCGIDLCEALDVVNQRALLVLERHSKVRGLGVCVKRHCSRLRNHLHSAAVARLRQLNLPQCLQLVARSPSLTALADGDDHALAVDVANGCDEGVLVREVDYGLVQKVAPVLVLRRAVENLKQRVEAARVPELTWSICRL